MKGALVAAVILGIASSAFSQEVYVIPKHTVEVVREFHAATNEVSERLDVMTKKLKAMSETFAPCKDDKSDPGCAQLRKEINATLIQFLKETQEMLPLILDKTEKLLPGLEKSIKDFAAKAYLSDVKEEVGKKSQKKYSRRRGVVGKLINILNSLPSKAKGSQLLTGSTLFNDFSELNAVTQETIDQLQWVITDLELNQFDIFEDPQDYELMKVLYEEMSGEEGVIDLFYYGMEAGEEPEETIEDVVY